MPSKRRSKSTSSSSHYSSSASPPSRLTICKISPKKELSSVPSTSFQLLPERILTFMEDERSYMERTVAEYTPPQTMNRAGTSNSVDHQLQQDLKKSSRKRISPEVLTAQLTSNAPKRKVTVPHEKYFEGCLVMAPLYPSGYSFWPGMIRKPCAGDSGHSDYIWERGGVICFCVQFFTKLRVVDWRADCVLRVFDPAKLNPCDYSAMDPTEFDELKKAIRIAKDASNYSVKERLEKFTMPNEAPIDCVIAEIDDLNNTSNATTTQQPLPCLPQNDAARFANSALKRINVTSATAQQSTRKLMRSKGRKSARPSSLKKVWVPKPHEKYFEGCLVMARIERDYPIWPGIIRKPGADCMKTSDYICKMDGKLRLFVQFFSDQTFVRWQIPGDLRVFNAAKPNRCNKTFPNLVISFEKGMRIARAASKFSVEARLEKFTLSNGAAVDNLLAEIDIGENFHSTTNAATQQQHPPELQNNSFVLDKNTTAPTTQETGLSCPDLVPQHEVESAPPTDDNGESCRESVEKMMLERILEYQQKLRDECKREKNEEIKRLTTDKEKLENTVKEQAKEIADLHEQREKERLEYKHEMEKEKQEKIKYKQELEIRIEVFDKLIPQSQT